MYKKDFISVVSKDTKLSKKEVALVLDSIASNIVKAMKKDDIVQWKGLGTFKLVTRSARTCHNPLNGKVIKVPARRVASFKMGTTLKGIKK